MNLLQSYFGKFGGMYVPQTLVPALYNLESEFIKAINDSNFQTKLLHLLKNYAGRPTPLTLCNNLTHNTKTKIYLKREDLLHGGAHKTNQVIGQSLLAVRMKKKEIIVETGAGQHGVAAAMISSLFNLKCRVYMGEKDFEQQKSNVFRMELLGALVICVKSGSRSLKDACNEAMRDWSENYKTAHYLIGTAAGPHPYPTIVKNFQKIIGEETKIQILKHENRLPDAIIACVGGGSNAIGIFSEFLQEEVVLIGVEPAGLGMNTKKHGAPLNAGKTGIYFGMKSKILQNSEGQIQESWSVSSGLDFPSVGPEHAWLNSIGRVQYTTITDKEAIIAFHCLCKLEGILPALESAHALAYAIKLAKSNPNKKQILVVNLSGRGDKDIDIVKNFNNTKKEDFTKIL